jgi:PAP2 superfamily
MQMSTCVAVVALLLSSPLVARADVVVEWNVIMMATLAEQNPFAQARFAAITHAAMFEAVNAITWEYEPYMGTVTALPGASPEAAAIVAAHDVLVTYFPDKVSALDASRDASLALLSVDDQSKADGIAVGAAAATAMIQLRANDGSSPPLTYSPTSSSPGQWQLTPGCAAGVFFHWQYVTPFAIQSSGQFRSDLPPALTSTEYTKAYNEVATVGAQPEPNPYRPEDRSVVAKFYAAVLAGGVWNQVAQQLAAAHGTSLIANARAFALMNMAISDALVTVMETKYYYAFWRPYTAIRDAQADGNPKTVPNADFLPFIPTPCFPSYPSAHATASYAARRVVQDVWGAAGHSIDLIAPPASNLPPLLYTSLKEITDDIDDARVYGGIHFRFDQESGARQGWRIGEYILKNYLRPMQF